MRGTWPGSSGVEVQQDWGSAIESYHLVGTNGTTELTVEMDIVPEFEQYMKDTLPRALDKVKEISER